MIQGPLVALTVKNELVLRNGLESGPGKPSPLYFPLLFLLFCFCYILSFFAEQLLSGRKHE